MTYDGRPAANRLAMVVDMFLVAERSDFPGDSYGNLIDQMREALEEFNRADAREM